MFFLRSVRRLPQFPEGLRASAPVATGIAAWGLMTGVAMVKSGMSVVEAIAMTLLVYAGSSQLAAIPLLVAGAPPWVVWATGFCVNLRFVVFSLHLRQYLMHLPRWRRLVNGFLTADLTYALFTSRYPEPATDAAGRSAQEAYLAGNYCLTWLAWTGASLAGIALGNAVPSSWGLGFAGVLCLVGILCSMANSPLRVLAAAVAGAVAVAAYALPLKLNIVVAIGAAVLAATWLEGRRGAPPRQHPA
ncbi:MULTISPECIES: AzlC family ABC transporter permease [Ramlibacter]|uniref:Branched-chain amino acid ABC transporter permease n=1 Tax=Ramlibacter pinisoli TaxID=2682844 RepID=A0A6N8J3K7_9BURK|nr:MULTISPECIES: AzlC family ABC transporter permease [Ramlibacter]MBA2962967.1 AzlC family ABC transporter permease [Ramlibacter sp. CGMCC 1.13660]MVQ32910.1 branched-chain amino acid ABC transporter permease [Ramlibacter pinisoli]